MKYDAVIFDLDGVICSTDEYHYLAWKALADKQGIPFDRQTNQRLRGVSRAESLEIILRAVPERVISQEEKQAWMEEKNRTYRCLLERMGPADLPREVRTTLEALRAAGLRLGVGSSSRNTKFILSRIGLGSFFDAVADGCDIRHSKPDPEVFLLAAQRLEVPPGRCLVVEDAWAGIEAACLGGMDSAAIGDARKHPHRTYELARFSDLLRIVEGEDK